MPQDDAGALVELLKQSRGLDASGEQENDSWFNPALFPDAPKAAARIRRAIAEQETIGLFGDYDCDGITSSAQMIRALERRGVEPVVKLPHRVHDGYGLKAQHVDMFHDAGVKVLITVDTGITAHEAVDKANAYGMDVIILDHHHLLTSPNAYAILHPALSPHFPHPHPSAAGVVFIFLHALEESDHWEGRDIDLVLATIGVIADLVALSGYNRELVRAGLQAIQRLPMSPLKVLIDQVSNGKPVTSVDIAFRIAPRINAAGRMADPTLALRAILEGGILINDLDTLNALRQDQTSRALERAMLELTPNADGELPAFLSIASSSYPHGILGLLAGKLTDKYSRPSMAVHISGELCTASLRSPAHFNIVEALHRVSHLLLSHGGHAQAAGCTFALDHYVTLTDALAADAALHIKPEQLVPTLGIDAVLPSSAITQSFCNLLTDLEPYGQGNPEPLFLIENVMLENLRRVGGEGRHLQATIGSCKVIGFNIGHLMEDVREPMDIVCRVGMDTWNGVVRPQLSLVDVRPVHAGKLITAS